MHFKKAVNNHEENHHPGISFYKICSSECGSRGAVGSYQITGPDVFREGLRISNSE